ncbi:MAG TPA: VOC family protein [Candidatus Saccharimonadales bacterium]|jgi:predicted 3-demethylubiquinone-9 3-methyltransferase (glyoxalase superfamily)|nr:VOC family protein [Candidatus Saccharimonadales bacterium]
MPKITPSLWFDKEAEAAINFYVAVFKSSPSGKAADSGIVSLTRYPGGYSEGPLAGMEGKILNGIFKLAGQTFMALDGGPIFQFNEAISLVVECEDQAEIDYFWDKLSAVPESEQCGWLKDKFGLSWQIVPNNMAELMKPASAMDAMLKMKKLDIAQLEAAGK